MSTVKMAQDADSRTLLEEEEGGGGERSAASQSSRAGALRGGQEGGGPLDWLKRAYAGDPLLFLTISGVCVGILFGLILMATLPQERSVAIRIIGLPGTILLNVRLISLHLHPAPYIRDMGSSRRGACLVHHLCQCVRESVSRTTTSSMVTRINEHLNFLIVSSPPHLAPQNDGSASDLRQHGRRVCLHLSCPSILDCVPFIAVPHQQLYPSPHRCKS